MVQHTTATPSVQVLALTFAHNSPNELQQYGDVKLWWDPEHRAQNFSRSSSAHWNWLWDS